MTNLDTKGWEQRWSNFLDEIVSDKGRSQTFISSKHSIEMTDFIRQELSLAKQQWIEESKNKRRKYWRKYDSKPERKKYKLKWMQNKRAPSYLKGGKRGFYKNYG